MTQSRPSENQQENTYLIDSNNSAEMARLLEQDRLITDGMGGIFPERDKEDMQGITKILDIACGPGGWVLDVARTYPGIEVTGIDISQSMIEYARAHAEVQQLRNARFAVMNALKPLQFADNTFDLVNARTVVGFMTLDGWEPFLAECMRVLKPGGIIRLTENEWGFSNAFAFETLCGKAAKALQLSGRSFSPTGLHLGLTAKLGYLLRHAGFGAVQLKAHVIDFSYGSKGHEVSYQDYRLLFPLIKPLLFGTKVVKPEEFDALYEQAMEEMQREDFCSIWYMLTAWGEKR